MKTSSDEGSVQATPRVPEINPLVYSETVRGSSESRSLETAKDVGGLRLNIFA